MGIKEIGARDLSLALLSSPREKHLKMSNKMEAVWKIENGGLGIVNLNNMIPCIQEVRCCNFSLLEEKCKEYNKSKLNDKKEKSIW